MLPLSSDHNCANCHLVIRLNNITIQKPAPIIDPLKVMASFRKFAESPFFISADQVKLILKDHPGLTINDLLTTIVPHLQEYARPLISEYCVAVVGLGASGNVYGGVNLEFQDLPSTLHGEQFMTINARNHAESYITVMALSAAPCGCCRQFLNEIGSTPGKEASNIQFLIPQTETLTLGQLLPYAFGPQDLGKKGGLLSPTTMPTSLDMTKRAQEAAQASYSPYSNCLSGVAIKTTDGKIFSGSYLENAAFNPAVPPLTAALVDIVLNGYTYEDIEEVVLAQKPAMKVNQYEPTLAVLYKICPDVKLQLVDLE